MTRSWSMVEAATGKVLRTGSTSNPKDVPNPRPGESRLDSVSLDGSLVYLNNGIPTPRPELLSNDKIDGGIGIDIAIGTLPRGTKVIRDGVDIGEVIGPLTVRLNSVGSTRLKLRPPFPYKPMELIVTAGRAQLERDRKNSEAARRNSLRQGVGGVE